MALFADAHGKLEDELDTIKYPVSFLTDAQCDLIDILAKSCNENFRTVITQHNESAKEYTHGGYMEDWGLNTLSLMCCADITQYFLTKPTAEYHTNIVYTGGMWPYKDKYLNQYILPLCYPNSKLKVKIFGSGWSTPNCLGRASEETIRNYYASADIVPAIFEPHAIEVYSDLPQRIFQVAACGGFQLSQKAIGLEEVFTEEEILTVEDSQDFLACVNRFISHEGCRKIHSVYGINGAKRVYSEHTNLHRAGKLLDNLDENSEWFFDKAVELYNNTFHILQ